MPPYDARMIANYLLDLADQKGLDLTQAALLKILYFCHGWYLVFREAPLSANQFEAWEYGPVVRVVRDAFKNNGRTPIKTRAARIDLLTGGQVEIDDLISVEDKLFVEKIFDYYSRFSTPQLINMTHEKNSPWDRIWNASEPFARLGLRLKDSEIREHFLKSQRQGFIM